MSDLLVSTSEPAGLVLVSASDVRVAEWHEGGVEELRRAVVEDELADPRELAGPPPGHPRDAVQAAPGAHAASHRDVYDRRVVARRVQFVRDAADEIARLAASRGWDVVLVLGDPQLGGPAVDELGRRGVRVVASDAVLSWLTPSELHARVAPELERVREELQLALLQRIRDEAVTGGRGALAPDDCRTTARAGRIDTLLIDPSIDGAEEIAVMAHDTGGRVIAAVEAVREPLAEAGGVAALLRW